MDETTLLRRAADGDAAAWEPLMETHQQAVFRLCYLLLGDPDDAEDTAQETFLRAWKHIGRFDSSRPLRPWLLSIAAHLASNRRRSAGRYLAAITRVFQSQAPSAGMEESSIRRSETDTLRKAVQRMSLPDQKIVYLRYFLELSVEETAEILQVAEGTVKSRLSRALDKLKDIIRQDFPALAEGRKA